MDNSSPKIYTEFLPISRADMEARGWEQLDFVVVGGDAYVDHPSFGTAIISRLLEAEGYKVGVLAQPRYTDCEDFKRFGKPKYGFFIGGGNVDSMVSHYSVAKIPRAEDEYSPGGKGGARPDRSATVYTRLAKQAYPDLPVILGGLEASLRRFAHYDYWLDTVLPSIAEDSGADIISFGMGEHQTVEIARRLAAGEPVESITDVDGTCYMTDFDHLPERYVECAGFKKVASDKTAYAKACRIQMDNQDVVSGQIIVQKQSEKYLVQNIPAKPLVRGELDKVYALPYTRRYHPIYESMGGVPAIREVQFSIIQNRGCFGGCNFCAIQLHQGRRVTSRSADSIVAEAERMTHEPDFKGYIHDVGGPTANFRFPSCREQMLRGMCTGGKHCLAPTTCSHMIVDHSDYLKILRRVRELPGVKKVFIRSGIRFDYLMADPDDTFFKELVEYHVSGQLKVAPEHCAPNTLAYMGKPPIETFNKFKDKFYELSKKAGKKQYLVPYLMSSHPGSTLKDAVYLAEYLYKNHMRPEQVQDFYPTPGTVSTCMFYTGLDPYTLKPVFVEKTPEGKALQWALLQYYEPRNAEKVVKALKMTHREDLIPLLVPAAGRRAMQRSARRAEAADVTIHNDGTYTVREPEGPYRQACPRPEPRRCTGRPCAQPRRTLCAPFGTRAQAQKRSTERERNVENWKEEKVTPHKKSLWQRLAALAAAAALVLSLAGCSGLPSVPGGSADVVPNPSSAAAAVDTVDAPLEVHFIDVGQALSVLVECDGQFMLYDGGNVDDGSLVVSYLQSQGVEQLEYVFCSHAHEDHVGGLAAALAYFPAYHVYSPVTDASTKCFQDFVKYTQQQGLQVEVPAVGTMWPLGGATVTMLGPVAQYSDTNDTSLVLRIDYGSTSFLLTGDMEKTAETDLVNSGANLRANVLQVGHHGSSTSTSYLFLNAVLPEMGVISCGVNNKYGHPHEETLSILRDAGVDVYRTDLQGTITIGSDGQNYTVGTEHFAADSALNPTDPAASSTAQQTYIGNVNSKKFHLPSCPNLPAEKNQVLFSSYEEAVEAGYTPCSSCIK